MIKVDEMRAYIGGRLISRKAPDVRNNHGPSEISSLVFYSKFPMKIFAKYFRCFPNETFATYGEQLYCDWGIYSKLFKSKQHDAHDMLQNGAIIGIAGCVPLHPLVAAAHYFTEKSGIQNKISKRYYIRISPFKGGKVVQGQTVHKQLFEIKKDKGNSFTLGAVFEQLEKNELFKKFEHAVTDMSVTGGLHNEKEILYSPLTCDLDVFSKWTPIIPEEDFI